MANEGLTYIAVLASVARGAQTYDVSLHLLAGPAWLLGKGPSGGCSSQGDDEHQEHRPRAWGIRPMKPTRLALGEHVSRDSIPLEHLVLASHWCRGRLSRLGKVSWPRGRYKGSQGKKQRTIISFLCLVRQALWCRAVTCAKVGVKAKVRTPK